MKRLPVTIFALLLTVSLLAPTTQAHHAASGLYDGDSEITVSGRVTSVFWRNPHVRFTLTVPAPDGTESDWEIEAGSVNSLERMGVTPEVVTPGSFVAVTGLPGRDGAPIAYARSIESAAGEQISMFFTLSALDEHYELERAEVSPDAAVASDIFRVWVPVSVPNTGSGVHNFPLTAAARAARAAWDPANDPALRCEPPGMPAAMDNPYPIELENLGDTILLRLEEWDGLRTIVMDGTGEPPPDMERTPMGYSAGRWDGDDLVVETTAISYPYFDDLGTPQSEALRMTERFALDRDRGVLTWTGEITDPATFTAPVTLTIEWHYIPGNSLKTFDCAVSE